MAGDRVGRMRRMAEGGGVRRRRPTTRSGRALAAALAALLVVLPFSPATGQELAATGGVGTSDFPELGAPVTAALHLRMPLEPAGMLGLVLGGRLGRDAGREPGITCDRYWPSYTACLEEPVAHASWIVQLELGVSARVPLGPLALGAGVVGVETMLAAGSEGVETGRSAGNYYPEEAVTGWAGMAEAVWPRPGSRLGFIGRVRRQDLDFHGCVTDTGTPFCGEERLITFEVGVILR